MLLLFLEQHQKLFIHLFLLHEVLQVILLEVEKVVQTHLRLQVLILLPEQKRLARHLLLLNQDLKIQVAVEVVLLEDQEVLWD